MKNNLYGVVLNLTLSLHTGNASNKEQAVFFLFLNVVLCGTFLLFGLISFIINTFELGFFIIGKGKQKINFVTAYEARIHSLRTDTEKQK